MQAAPAIYEAELETENFLDDSFSVLPRNCDSAVVYWNLGSERMPLTSVTRLSLQVNGKQTGAEEMVILHRESGHFIIPLLADDRDYKISLGWADENGFRTLFSQTIRLPEYPKASVGAMSNSLSFRGAHFWPKGYGSSVN